jgi:hypothetical protein
MARKKKAPAKASTRNYSLSKGFLWGFWAPQLLLAALLGFLALGFASGKHPWATGFFCLGAAAYLLLFSYYLLNSVGKRIEAAQDALSLVDRKGERLSLRWNRISRVEHRPILQQMVLFGPGDVRIPIQYLTKGFPELLKRILVALDLHTPSAKVASSFAGRSQGLTLETKGVRLVRGSNVEFLEWAGIAKLELGTVRSLCSLLSFHLDLLDMEGNRHRFRAPLS